MLKLSGAVHHEMNQPLMSAWVPWLFFEHLKQPIEKPKKEEIPGQAKKLTSMPETFPTYVHRKALKDAVK